MGANSDFTGFSDSMNGFTNEAGFKNSSQYVDATTVNGYGFETPFLDSSLGFSDNQLFAPDPGPNNSAFSSIMSADAYSPSDDNDFSETVLSFINQMLMEEDMEEKPCMFHDPLALQAAEKSYYNLLGENHPSSPDQPISYGDQFLVDSPNDGFSSSSSDCSSYSNSSSLTHYSVDPLINGETSESKPSFMQVPLPTNFVFQSSASPRPKPAFQRHNGLSDNNGNKAMGSFVDKIVIPNFFSEGELALQFNKGVEEANKFLPKVNQLVVGVETTRYPNLAVKAEKEDGEHWVLGKKNHDREDEDLEDERKNKQTAVFLDESELSEMFDKVLVCAGEKSLGSLCILDETTQCESGEPMQQNSQSNGSSGNKTRAKRQGMNKKEVDLRTLLVLCAQAVSADNRTTAYELLKQIRQHSSPFGDGSQRLAHCFANALEARLAGTGTQIYIALSAKRTSAADMLKAYQTYISTCPFKKLAIIFANHNIIHLAEKAKTLHIIDFGILYGFQWPGLIYRLSKMPGGPPKLRITGIELPQSGFRPADGVQATGQRLAKYCERHNVPFEYNGIAQKWETIQLSDLKINECEILAVNCLFRAKNLLDESVAVDCPRDGVLRLIRKTNPDIFIHSVVNGSYNAPFFITRFREALFHFTALFDICDINMSREDETRWKFEKEFFGREVMNVIACEGSERVERPETHKQWQIRCVRAGLKQFPLEPLFLKKLQCKAKSEYDSDFVVDADGGWLLQGWKGRIVFASSAWVPA